MIISSPFYDEDMVAQKVNSANISELLCDRAGQLEFELYHEDLYTL